MFKMVSKTKKVIVEREFECAHCGKANKVIVEKETITPAVPAETEILVRVEKGDQTKLTGE